MAIAKTGPILGALSGNLAGANFANSRFGLTVRAVKPPPGPPTETQFIVTRSMQLARQWWRDITDDQRAAWRIFAANTLLRNRLGTQRNLTGQQTFIRHNFQSAAFGLPWRPDPPTPWPFDWPSDFILTVTAGVSAIVGPTPPHLPGGDPFIVSAARPVTTHPINHFQRWAIIALPTTVFGGTFDCLSEIQARFGTLQSGERIGVRIRYLDPAMPKFGWLEHATTVI
jgi:hypothetical protein